MGVHLYEHKLSYFSVPKCACTSLKLFFFEIENGFEFRTYRANGTLKHIHNAAYPCRAFESEPIGSVADHWKIAVIRDPLDRLVSCYANRVLYLGELDAVRVTQDDRSRGIVPRPDLSTFVEHLDRYAELSPSIAHHTTPMVQFLGRDPSFFDRIYHIEDLAELVDDVGARVGDVPGMQRHQRGGGMSTEDLTADQKERLRLYYAEDFEVFGDVLARTNRQAPAAVRGEEQEH